MSLKDLKIKTGVVKRLYKELLSYEKEHTKQQERIDKMIADNADSYDIKKQKEVLEETTQMIPDSKRRLAAAYKDLQDMMTELEKRDSSMASSEEWSAAQTILGEVTVQ